MQANWKKILRYVPLVAIIVGVALSCSSYFMAQGKLGVFTDRKNLYYQYDESLIMEGNQSFKDIKNLHLNVNELYVSLVPADVNEVIVSYKYRGKETDLTISNDAGTLSIDKPNPIEYIGLINFGPDIQTYMEIKYPKNLNLNTVDVEVKNADVTIKDQQNIETLQVYNKYGTTNLENIKAKNIEVGTSAGNVVLYNVLAENSLDANSFDTKNKDTSSNQYGSFEFKGVATPNAILDNMVGNILINEATFGNEVILERAKEALLDNVKAKGLSVSDSYSGEHSYKNIEIENNLVLTSTYSGISLENSKAKNITLESNQDEINLKEVEATGDLNMTAYNSSINMSNVKANNISQSNEDAYEIIVDTVESNSLMLHSNSQMIIDNITVNELNLSGNGGIISKEANVKKSGVISAMSNGDISLTNFVGSNMIIEANTNEIIVNGGHLVNSQVKNEYGAITLDNMIFEKENKIAGTDSVMITLKNKIEDYTIKTATENGTLTVGDRTFENGGVYEKLAATGNSIIIEVGHGDILIDSAIKKEPFNTNNNLAEEKVPEQAEN